MIKATLVFLAIGLGSTAEAWTQSEAYDVLSNFSFDLSTSSNKSIKTIVNYFNKGVGTKLNAITECTTFLLQSYDQQDKFDVLYTRKMLDEVQIQIGPNGQKLAWISKGLDSVNAFKATVYYTSEYVQNLCYQEQPVLPATVDAIQHAKQDMNLSNLILNSLLRELR